MPVLLEYAGRLQNGSLSSWLGYLLELLGQPTHDLMPSNGPVRLDPKKPVRGVYNKRWQLYINLDRKELFPEGVV
jgi:predicted transcriptional regulator of viral defense system